LPPAGRGSASALRWGRGPQTPIHAWLVWGQRCLIAAKGDAIMFSVGQRVWLRGKQDSGVVVECDGDRVYLEQDNGVELDFRTSDLTAEPPNTPGAKPEPAGPKPRANLTAANPAARPLPNRRLTPRDITPEHLRVLAAIPVRTLQAIAALYERRPNAGRFSALDAAGKLNVVTEITTVPYRIMRRYTDSPGELGLLMGKGLADSGKAG